MSTKGQTPTALDEAACSALKAEISRVIQSALDGSDETLRYEKHWIRWGLVEQRIHSLVDVAFKAPNVVHEPQARQKVPDKNSQ